MQIVQRHTLRRKKRTFITYFNRSGNHNIEFHVTYLSSVWTLPPSPPGVGQTFGYENSGLRLFSSVFPKWSNLTAWQVNLLVLGTLIWLWPLTLVVLDGHTSNMQSKSTVSKDMNNFLVHLFSLSEFWSSDDGQKVIHKPALIVAICKIKHFLKHAFSKIKHF